MRATLNHINYISVRFHVVSASPSQCPLSPFKRLIDVLGKHIDLYVKKKAEVKIKRDGFMDVDFIIMLCCLFYLDSAKNESFSMIIKT